MGLKFSLCGGCVVKRHFVAASVLLAMAGLGTAQAAPPAPIYNWTGFYVGVHAGHSWGSQNWTQTFNNQGNPNDTTSSALPLNGFLGGLQAGYNFQSGPWVFGLEGDWSWTGAKGCAGNVIFFTYESCSQANWYATATGRIGYAFDRSLIFVRGGAAFTQQKHYSNLLGVIDTQETNNVTSGFIIGGGIEHAITPNWSVKLEYNFMDFGKKDTPLTYLASGSSPGLQENWDVSYRVHVVKVGINYRFASGATAITAK